MDQQLFIDAYLECALWSSSDPDTERPLDDDYGIEDLEPVALADMTSDCVDFINGNSEDLDLVIGNADSMASYDAGCAGHDFWLTRNGHGAGFWDRYYGVDNDLRAAFIRLSDASQVYGACDLLPTDDGTLAI
jgi:hypothetical protein